MNQAEATGQLRFENPNNLNPNPRNPNQHSNEQIKRICEVIKAQGFRVPIVVSTRSNLVIAGHGRLRASLELGLEKVPVLYQEFKDESQENLHMLADNRLAELAETDNAMLKDIIQDLDTGDINLDLTGYTEAEIGNLMSQFFQGDDTGATPIEDLETYENTAIRQIVLICNVEEFEQATQKLAVVRQENNLESNTEAMLWLLNNYK